MKKFVASLVAVVALASGAVLVAPGEAVARDSGWGCGGAC